MNHSLFRKDIRPFVLWLSWLLLLTLAIDYLLHQYQLKWTERYSGILGTFLIVISFAYSLRKKKIITFGKPTVFLVMREYPVTAAATKNKRSVYSGQVRIISFQGAVLKE